MSYRKFRANQLFTGFQLLDDQHVLITNEQGGVLQIVPLPEAGEDIAAYPGTLCPGFINCHCHLELSHMKGLIPAGTGMIDFLLGVIRQRNFPKEQIAQAIAEAELAMLHNGIVAVGDICNTTDTIEQKRQGRLYYHNFIEAIGFVEATAAERFADAKRIFEQFAGQYSLPVESNSIVPHAPYSVSAALFGLIKQFPGNHLLTMHNQESEAENEFFIKGKGNFLRLYEELKLDISFYQPPGTSSLQYCLQHFYPNQSLILVHNSYIGEEDLAFIHDLPAPQANPKLKTQNPKPKTHFCLCPNANNYIGNRLPDVDLLRRYNVSIVVGTDSLASNHQLSILEELNTIRRNFSHIPVAELLQWATLNGAKALELDSLLGSFEPGKQPGVLVIDDGFNTVQRLL